MDIQFSETLCVELPEYALRLSNLSDPPRQNRGSRMYEIALARILACLRVRRLRKRLEVARKKFEELIIEGNLLFENLRLAQIVWRTEILHGERPYDEQTDREFAEKYRVWTQPVAKALETIDDFKADGFALRGAEAFRDHFDEAQQILSGDDPLFRKAGHGARWAEVTAFLHPKPRPVHIDEQGRIFELSGERFSMPGLEPEDILEALEDVKHGRLISNA